MSVALGLEHLRHLVDVFFFHHLPTLAIIRSRVLNKKKDSVKGRGSHPGLFCKKGVRKDFTKCTGKSLCRSLFLIKLHVFRLELYQKETPVQMFSLELCKIFQNRFFTEQIQTVASVRALDSRQPLNIFVKIHHRYPTGF